MNIIRKYNDFIKEALENAQEAQSSIEQTQPVQQVQQTQELQPIQQSQMDDSVDLDLNKTTVNKVNKIIDYTLIKKGLIKENVKQIVEEAIENNFYAICVNPDFVDYVVYELEDSDIKVVSTLDFPEGKMSLSDKMTELVKVISDGADEIDLSIDITEFKDAYINEDEELKESSYLIIEKDIKKIADECHKNGVVLKVIVESGILSFDELEDLCGILSNANIDFVQTSSGMKEVGAELDKIKEIRRLLPDYIKIKASGGIRTIEEANKFYPYVDRIGTSSILK